MRSRTLFAAAAPLAVLALMAPTACRPGPLRDRIIGRTADPAPPAQEESYGRDPLQKIDFWHADTNRPAPLVIFVHGGAWKAGDKRNATGGTKVRHWQAAGYAVASVDYRLVPAATVEQQAADVAHAIAWLIGHGRELDIDTGRVALIGHSAGAHLAALVGTDMRYFADAGLRPDAVRGVILLDGAAYDVPRQIADAGSFLHGAYLQAFGSDPARQRALSPIFAVAQPNAPGFLILHIDRADGTAQSNALAAALNNAGTPARVQGFEGKGLRGHMQINRELGDPGYPATSVVDGYLRRVFGS